MTDSIDPTITGSIIQTVGGAILGGGGVTAFFRRRDKARRDDRKDAGQLANEILEQTLARIAKLEGENAECAKRLPILEIRLERTQTVLKLTLADLHSRAPDSPAIIQARAILGNDAFAPPPEIPPDMQAQLDKLK